MQSDLAYCTFGLLASKSPQTDTSAPESFSVLSRLGGSVSTLPGRTRTPPLAVVVVALVEVSVLKIVSISGAGKSESVLCVLYGSSSSLCKRSSIAFSMMGYCRL